MINSFIDTHAHLYGEEFSKDITAVIARAKGAGALKIFLPNIDEISLAPMMKLCSDHPDFCYPMLGIHPTDIPDAPMDVLAHLELLLQKDKHPFIAIGEVGLDLYWDKSHFDEQIRVFTKQVEWSLKYHLPLMIHVRSAHNELLKVLQPYKNEKELCGVFHCFAGTSDEAIEMLSFEGFSLGIGGIVTFKKSVLPEALGQVPLNRIVLETDAPYMAPVPYRGKRNESSYIPAVIEKLAEIYRVDASVVAQTTTDTVRRIFPRAFENS